MFWKSKSPLTSEEYEILTKKIVSVVGDLDVLTGGYKLLTSDVRKLRVELRKSAKELEELEVEGSKKEDSVYL